MTPVRSPESKGLASRTSRLRSHAIVTQIGSAPPPPAAEPPSGVRGGLIGV